MYYSSIFELIIAEVRIDSSCGTHSETGTSDSIKENIGDSLNIRALAKYEV